MLPSKPAYRPDAWWTTEYNSDPNIQGVALADRRDTRVTIHDVTLREAEQGFPVIFKADEMYRIAEELVRVGVRRAEMWPVLSRTHQEAMRRITAQLPELELYALARPGYSEDVALALESGAKGLLVFTLSLNDFIVENALGTTPEAVIDGLLATCQEAKELGLRVTLSVGDAPRASLDRLQRIFTAAAELSVDGVSVNDSFGCSLPSTFGWLVRQVREWVGDEVNVETHCHNDWGLATANALSGLASGANVVHTAVNGYGERAGNTSFEELVMGAEALLGLDTGVETTGLLNLSELVADMAGVDISANKPIVGEGLHRIWTGLHSVWRDRVAEAGRSVAWSPFSPKVIGRDDYSVELGPMAGQNLIILKLRELGLDAADVDLGAIRDKVKEEGRVRKRPVPDSEFRRIVAREAARRS